MISEEEMSDTYSLRINTKLFEFLTEFNLIDVPC
jgi:hypothetical protein